MTNDSERLQNLKLQKLELLRKEASLRPFLPHRYALPHYKWSRAFFESRNRECFLTAANQVGKSTVQIRRIIEWATETSLWPTLWPEAIAEGKQPNLFWYLYPDSNTLATEWETKWKPLMPKEGMDAENWAKYGWEPIKKGGLVTGIRWFSGVRMEFRYYSQETSALQAGTVYYIAFDEELPIEHIAELEFRLSDTRGYMSGVFTATLGQKYWWDVMEGEGEEELRVDAFKQQISLYDCQEYEDGTLTKWTNERIEERKKRCPTEADIRKRIYGKFAAAGNLKYEGFDKTRNMVSSIPIPPTWKIYAAVDVGSGLTNHKAAITFIAVNPEYTQGRIFKAWRGDNIRTTAGDVLTKYRTMKMLLEARGYRIEAAAYDWAAKDFFTMATAYGEPFQPANKARDAGELTMNALFKNRMLLLHTGDPEIEKLASELLSTTNRKDTSKNQDDLCDSTRYCVMLVPWDWTVIDEGTLNDKEAKMPEPIPELSNTEDRLAYYRGTGPYAHEQKDEVEDEIAFWAELYGE